MITIPHLSELRAVLDKQRQQGKRIGFVPTMGNLHTGHLSLVRHALEHADYVVSSIYVNPLQFGANEDLDNYPRTLTADKKMLVEAGNHALFLPTTEQIYPQGSEHHTKVLVPELTRYHCGESRPGHFDGVSTVVNILFNMVQPDMAVFGEKDFQQLAVIRKMTQDLCLNIEIAGCPIVREPNGLAKSSRNGYLTDEQRKIASNLHRIICATAKNINNGNRNYTALQDQAKAELSDAGFEPDYFNIAESTTLSNATANDKRIVILAAAFLGSTRLIDNSTVSL